MADLTGALLLILGALAVLQRTAVGEPPAGELPEHVRGSGLPTEAEVQAVQRWADAAFTGEAGDWLDGWLGTGLPFAFDYDGRPFAEMARQWPCTRRNPVEADGGHSQVITWQAPDGLQVICHVRRFDAFPAVDWLLSFRNTGAEDSGLIEGVQSLSLRMTHALAGRVYTVAGAHGGRCGRDDFMPFRLSVPAPRPETSPTLNLVRQDYEQLEVNQSILRTPLTIGDRQFASGLGTHATSHLRMASPQAMARFSAWVGVDANERTRGGAGSVVFVLVADGVEVYRSAVMRGGEAAVAVEVDLGGAQVLDLHVEDGGDGPTCDHADWAEASVTFADGTRRSLTEIPRYRPDGVVLGSKVSSSNEELPFFGIESPEGRGVLIGIGWTGQWRAAITREDRQLTARAGLPETRFRLHPGEEVRGPRIMMLAWSGEALHGHNMLRALLREHYVPRLRPGLEHPLVTVNTCFTHNGAGDFLTQANAANLQPLVEPFADLGAEAFIIDAGWYKCQGWMDLFTTKDYAIDPGKYPEGFRPLSDPLAAAGVVFGLWCPPEALGRMDDPANRDRFLQIMDDFVRNEGLGLYRQDMGFVPPPEAPDRVGVSEMQHIAGLYALLDEMRRRYPDLIMEGCSSGGRRVDLETLSRFHWHQKSDRWYDSVSDQCGMYGGNLFLPGGALNLPTTATDDFGAWSSFGGQFSLGWHPIADGFPMAQAKRQVALYKRLRPCLAGDFYPLTPCDLGATWLAYQFHRRDLNQGFALVFKREASAGDAFRLSLQGLEPDSGYQVLRESAGEGSVFTGRDLAAGLDLAVEATPGAEIVSYTALP